MKREQPARADARKAAVLATIIGVAAVARSARPTPAPLEDAIEGLASPSGDTIEASIRKLGALDDPRGAPALEALCDDRLRVGADGPSVHLGFEDPRRPPPADRGDSSPRRRGR